jgi:hypothetical protein
MELNGPISVSAAAMLAGVDRETVKRAMASGALKWKYNGASRRSRFTLLCWLKEWQRGR